MVMKALGKGGVPSHSMKSTFEDFKEMTLQLNIRAHFLDGRERFSKQRDIYM